MNCKMTDALDACLVRIRTGESVEACLATYPELKNELRSVLEIELPLEGLCGMTPSTALVDHAWANRRTRRPRPSRGGGKKLY